VTQSMRQPTEQEILETIEQLRLKARQLTLQASALEVRAAKLEYLLVRRQQREASA
jgi:hypothetical protein